LGTAKCFALTQDDVNKKFLNEEASVGTATDMLRSELM
jgi:hypothetical protein